jgi:tRNA nucleotidyltransferase (CCA-adding enzyme)
LQKTTAQLLRRDLAMIDTISGDRLRHEVELILKETYPERILRRADELGVLGQLHVSLRADDWLCNKFTYARNIFKRGLSPLLYLCLIIYILTEKDAEEFITRLNFPSRSASAMRQTLQLKSQLPVLGKSRLKSSAIYRLLHPYINPAIQANLVASESAIISRRINFYLSRLKSIKPLLTGEYLVAMGIPSGPGLGKILAALYDAKLDGEVRTREDEERFVREISAS